ncbi:unnamed protein product [Lymnaea stagnalis]|uniref:RING-type domain-containing protein n=1 Tax=Lymnaea stagnalis TaxID=6523 RepID=A0AAV2H2X6_LYMST
MSSNIECLSAKKDLKMIKPKCEGIDVKQLELHEVKRNKSSNTHFIAKVHRASSFSQDGQDTDLLVDAGFYWKNDELCCYSCDVRVKAQECNKPFDAHHETCDHIKLKQMDGCEIKAAQDDFLKRQPEGDPEADHECLKCKTKWRVILYTGCGHLVLCTDCFLEELHSDPKPDTDSAAQDNSIPDGASPPSPLQDTAEPENHFIICPLENCQRRSYYYIRVKRN